MTQLTVKYAEATFLQLQQSSQEIAEKCAKIEIVDDLTFQLATQNYSMLKSTIGQIEEIRVKEKAPYLDAGKQIDALAKKLSSPLETVLEGGKKKAMAYNQEKLRIAQAEQKRINDIKSAMSKYSSEAVNFISECTTMEELTMMRNQWVVEFPTDLWAEFSVESAQIKLSLNDLCKNKRIEITTPQQADETISESIKEAIVEKVAEVGIQEVAKAEFQTSTKFRGLPRFRVVDEKSIPREWLMLDESKVKAYQKEFKDTLGNGQVVHGIEFYIEESVNIR